MNRITYTHQASQKINLRSSEESLSRCDKRIRALFLATIALGSCLLVASCYHLPYNSILDAAGFGLICASMVALSIHGTRISKCIQSMPSPATLEAQDLTTLSPEEMRTRIRRMTPKECLGTKENLSTFIDNPRERRGIKISKEVAEILIKDFQFDATTLSRIVKPDQLSAYGIHPLLMLPPKEMEAKIKAMSPTEREEARKHVEENLKTLRIPFEMRYVLAVDLQLNPNLVYEQAGDRSCTIPYSLLEMGLAPQLITFETVQQLMGASRAQVAAEFSKISDKRIQKCQAYLKKHLPMYEYIPTIAFQYIAVAFEIDPPATEEGISDLNRRSLLKLPHEMRAPKRSYAGDPKAHPIMTIG